jgi:hypothetical protein
MEQYKIEIDRLRTVYFKTKATVTPADVFALNNANFTQSLAMNHGIFSKLQVLKHDIMNTDITADEKSYLISIIERRISEYDIILGCIEQKAIGSVRSARYFLEQHPILTGKEVEGFLRNFIILPAPKIENAI